MRSDLTPAFKKEMARNGRSPRVLAVFHFEAGDVFVSDQVLGVADCLANKYQAIVEDWGNLVDMAGGDPQAHGAGEIRQMTITLINSGTTPFSDLFLSEDPENVLVSVYQWFAGLEESDKALIDTFVVQDPIEYSESSKLLSLDLVSLAMRYDGNVGDLLTIENWPHAKAGDTGKGIDLVIGAAGQVPTLCAKTAPVTALNGSVLKGTLTITAHDNLDDLNFPASGTILINEEKIRYSSRTSSSFAVVQRGYLSKASEHLDRTAITFVIDDFTYLVGRGPVKSISSVKVGGFLAPEKTYRVDTDIDPARIVFTENPYSYQFARGSTFLEMQFDSVNDDNTAWQPHNAYDAAAKTSAAKINQGNRLLSLRQATVNEDRGEIVRAYLLVEHFETGGFLSDYVEVSIIGVGVVGRLSRPSEADIVEIEAEVDLDHGHSHSISGEHTHVFVDPTIITNDPVHGHASTGAKSQATFYPKGIVHPFIKQMYAFKGWGHYESVVFDGVPSTWTGRIFLKLSIGGVKLYQGRRGRTQVQSGTYSMGVSQTNGNGRYIFGLHAYGKGVIGGKARWREARLETISELGVETAHSAVSTYIDTAGENKNQTDKDQDDVDDFTDDNRAIDITSSNTATRTTVNAFDITENVNFNWGWFTGQDIKIEYKGRADDKDVYILHTAFDIEFRKKELIYSDDVTADVEGIKDDAIGSITGMANALIARPDHVRNYLLQIIGNLPASYIDTASFNNAGKSYADMGYAFAGILEASLSVREAEKKVAFQCRSRFFWNAGKAKIALRKSLADWIPVKNLKPVDLRVNSIKAKRQKLADIKNDIQLFFDADNLQSGSFFKSGSGNESFKASKSVKDASSIASLGKKEDRSSFQFDLVRSDSMAESLAEFYLETNKRPSTFYFFEAYLKEFGLEKEDIITLTAGFGKLNKAKMVIRAIDRVFASGKLGRMNYYQIAAECLRYFIIELTASDSVTAFDTLTISTALTGDFEEAAIVAMELTAAFEVAIADSITLSDQLAVAVENNSSILIEAVTSDYLVSHQHVFIEDSVTLFDEANAWRTSGFGCGGFGEGGFGGYSKWLEASPDSLTAFDELGITVKVNLGYVPALADSYGFGQSGFGALPFGDYGESVSLTDELVITEF